MLGRVFQYRSGPGDFFFWKALNNKFKLFNSYINIQVIYFLLGEFRYLFLFEELAHFILVVKYTCIGLIIDYDFLPVFHFKFIGGFFSFFSLRILLECSVLLIFQRNQLLVSFMFIVLMFSIAFISAFISLIFFFLLAWV